MGYRLASCLMMAGTVTYSLPLFPSRIREDLAGCYCCRFRHCWHWLLAVEFVSLAISPSYLMALLFTVNFPFSFLLQMVTNSIDFLQHRSR